MTNAVLMDKPVLTSVELQKYLPTNDETTYDLLKQDILNNGFTNPIVVAQLPNGDNYIADGHHRHRACTELNIEPTYQYQKFESIEAVKEWMLMQQLSKRNLTAMQKRYLAGMMKHKLAGKVPRWQIADGLNISVKDVRMGASLYHHSEEFNIDKTQLNKALKSFDNQKEVEQHVGITDKITERDNATYEALKEIVSDDYWSNKTIIVDDNNAPEYVLAKMDGRSINLQAFNARKINPFMDQPDEARKLKQFLYLKGTPTISEYRNKVIYYHSTTAITAEVLWELTAMTDEQINHKQRELLCLIEAFGSRQ